MFSSCCQNSATATAVQPVSCSLILDSKQTSMHAAPNLSSRSVAMPGLPNWLQAYPSCQSTQSLYLLLVRLPCSMPCLPNWQSVSLACWSTQCLCLLRHPACQAAVQQCPASTARSPSLPRRAPPSCSSQYPQITEGIAMQHVVYACCAYSLPSWLSAFPSCQSTQSLYALLHPACQAAV